MVILSSSKKILLISTLLCLLASCGEKRITIKFVDFDDSIIMESTVKVGEKPVSPTMFSRPGYEFVSWDKDFENAKTDIIVKPIYRKIEDMVFYITFSNIYTENEDRLVDVYVDVENNIGLYSFGAEIEFDKNIFDLYYDPWLEESTIKDYFITSGNSETLRVGMYTSKSYINPIDCHLFGFTLRIKNKSKQKCLIRLNVDLNSISCDYTGSKNKTIKFQDGYLEL